MPEASMHWGAASKHKVWTEFCPRSQGATPLPDSRMWLLRITTPPCGSEKHRLLSVMHCEYGSEHGGREAGSDGGGSKIGRDGRRRETENMEVGNYGSLGSRISNGRP